MIPSKEVAHISRSDPTPQNFPGVKRMAAQMAAATSAAWAGPS